MEAVSLALGVVGLIGAFKGCIDLFSLFSSHRSLGRDYEISDAKLHVEKAILLQWAQRVRLFNHDYDSRLDDSETNQAVARILASIQHLWGETTALREQYGLRPTQSVADLVVPRVSLINKTRMDKLTREFEAMKLKMSKRQRGVSHVAKLRWVIADKDKFQQLIQELSHFVCFEAEQPATRP
ncbi:hypothetical protein ACHAPT_008803 [Fusarium lateritium]